MTRRDEQGTTTLLIVGFAVVLAMAIGVVVDATAAYLQRQSLSTLADGAALQAADLGALGQELYVGGVPDERLVLTESAARAAVHAYLRDVGAYASYPGLVFAVDVRPADSTVTVEVRAPLDLPLTVPGSPDRATVGATGSAVTTLD